MNYRAILIAALEAVGLYVAGFLVPVLGQVVALFTPVPIIMSYVRDGRREGLSAIVIATGIIAVLAGWQVAAILLFSFGLMAIGIAEAMLRRLKAEYVALAGGLLPVVIMGISLAYYFININKNPVAVIESYLGKSLAESAKMYSDLGLKEMSVIITSVSSSFIHYLARLVPGIVITTFVFQAASCFGVVRALLIRKPDNDIALAWPSLAAWYAPDSWVWGLIVSLSLIAIPQETARFAGFNAAILLGVIYTAQGMAIVEHYFRKAGIHTVVRGLLHTAILILPVIVCVTALGVVDIWADFRKVRHPVVDLKA